MFFTANVCNILISAYLNVFGLFFFFPPAAVVLHESNSAGTDEEGLHPHQAH